jgi:prepilin-type N-terminal cleavage/methylation domain-containing protein
VRARLRQLAGEDGFTLIECLVAALIVGIGLVGTFALIDGASSAQGASRAREGATSLARDVLESVRGDAYASIDTGGLTSALQGMSGFQSMSGTAAVINRRSIAYTVTATVCKVDDPKDGLGTTDSSFCSPSTSGGMQYYDPVAMSPWTGTPRPSYDANGNNAVWVRSTVWGTNCRPQTVVALATRALKTLNWPTSVLSADWFKTSNNGSKVIVGTADANPSPTGGPSSGNVSLRCQGSGHTSTPQCAQYKSGQVAPDTVPSSLANSTPIIDANQLASLRLQAQQTNTYSSGCGLPAAWSTSLPTGTVVFVEGGSACPAVSPSGNAASNPYIFVLNDGTVSLGGNAKFYGLVYAHNASNLVNPAVDPTVVTLSGCAHIQGLIAVDGFGGVNVGSCKSNLTYDSSVLSNLKTYGGAVISRGTFRTLTGP